MQGRALRFGARHVTEEGHGDGTTVEAGHGRQRCNAAVGRIELSDDRHLPAPERPTRDRCSRLGASLGPGRGLSVGPNQFAGEVEGDVAPDLPFACGIAFLDRGGEPRALRKEAAESVGVDPEDLTIGGGAHGNGARPSGHDGAFADHIAGAHVADGRGIWI